MSIITIDNKDYDFEALSDAAQAQLQSMQFVDAELQKLQAMSAVFQTARAAYSKALIEALSATQPFLGGDTIKLS